MANDAEYRDLPFDEAVTFFRQKLNIPTRRWDDLWQGMHARGFMVAGATKDELLSDFRGAVDAAIAGGESLDQFRRRFDGIVAKHGWDYHGSRNWRSEVIYAHNVRPAYAAGRYQQMTDPDVLRAMPYWMYQHGDSVHPRPLHLEWNGTVLPANDPWFRTHFGPNGWGCKCKVVPLTRRDLARMGKDGPDQAPDDGTYTWTDRAGVQHTVPNGIDPGWAYNVGEAAWGRPVAERVLAEQAGGRWQDLGPARDARTYGRPESVPADPAVAAPGARAQNIADARSLLRQAIGGDSAVFRDPSGGAVLIDQAVVDHLAENAKRLDGREQYFPMIREVIEAPFEVWVAFAQNELTGKVSVRRRYVKMIRTDRDRVVAVIASAADGVWTGFDIFRGGRTALNNLRRGHLVWGRE